jgi:hypothetical protein
MSAQQVLLSNVHSTTQTGNRISTAMVNFLDNVKEQPLGFKGLGLNFLETCKILNALQLSLEEHFRTNQPFPEKAVPELDTVLRRTEKDFGELEGLLAKFSKYEAGGIAGRVMKTWRMVFADKDVVRIGGSLREGMAALRMATLLINM